MENTLHIIAVWTHILGIALFVGPQFFLAFAWVPAARMIPDQRVRAQLTRTLTRRFGWIGGIGLVLIVLADQSRKSKSRLTRAGRNRIRRRSE